MIGNLDSFFQDLYRNFNARNIDPVISNMTEDVKWANGMEGGHVYGHDGVREYWTRQFTMLNARVTPLTIDEERGLVKIKVHQVVHDLDRKLVADEYLYHHFSIVNDKIAEFNIGAKVEE